MLIATPILINPQVQTHALSGGEREGQFLHLITPSNLTLPVDDEKGNRSGKMCFLSHTVLSYHVLVWFYSTLQSHLGPPVERLKSGYPSFPVVYFSRGTLPPKKGKRALLQGPRYDP